MQQLVLVDSNPSVHFIGAIAQNAGEAANIALPAALGGGSSQARVRSLAISSKENLAWELWLFGTKGFRTGDVATERVMGRWTFAAGDGLQVGGAGLYSYYIDGLDLPYEDDDGTGQLHALLVNRSAAGKSAGAAGAVRVQLGMGID